MPGPFGLDGTPTVWTKSDGTHVFPANSFLDGGDHRNVIPWDHAYLHRGHRFYVNHRNLSIANGANVDLVVSVGATLNAHLNFTANLGGDFTVDIYEGVTASENGTLLSPRNFNREVASAGTVPATVSVRANPTVTPSATNLFPWYIPAGRGGNAQGGGDSREELIMLRSTKYLIRFSNVSGQIRAGAIHLDWYEHDPVGTGVT